MLVCDSGGTSRFTAIKRSMEEVDSVTQYVALLYAVYQNNTRLEMTYTVSSGTFNPTHSLTHSIKYCFLVYLKLAY